MVIASENKKLEVETPIRKVVGDWLYRSYPGLSPLVFAVSSTKVSRFVKGRCPKMP